MLILRHDKGWVFEYDLDRDGEPWSVRTQKRAFDAIFARLGPDLTKNGTVPAVELFKNYSNAEEALPQTFISVFRIMAEVLHTKALIFFFK